ncbi:MAG: hypothetical protein ACRENB_10780 [Gemmatimonadales bacterium]
MKSLGWRGWVAAIALFITGAAAGVAMVRLHHSRGDPHARLFEEIQRDPIGVMDRELHLRPEQRTRVAEILSRRQKDIDAVWSDTHVRLRATVDSVVAEIAAVLDPDQARRFRALADSVHRGERFLHPR